MIKKSEDPSRSEGGSGSLEKQRKKAGRSRNEDAAAAESTI